MTAAPRLVCVGNLTIDDLVLPDGSRRVGCIGGDALYSALGARLWEPGTQMLALVGADLPRDVWRRIDGAGLADAGLPKRATPTIRNVVTYDAHGGRTWELLGTDAQFHDLSVLPQDVPQRHLRADAFLVTAMSLESQEALVQWLRASTDALVVLDLQEDYIPGNEERILAMVAGAHVFMPSEEEVRRLLGTNDWMAAARRFAALGPRLVVIKLGARGALVHDAERERTFSATAVDVPVVDTTGAGDAYCGGFVAMLLRDRTDLGTAAAAGAVSASFAITGYGNEALLKADAAAAWRLLDEVRAHGSVAEVG